MCSLITLWFKNTNTAVPRLLRAFSGGIITALALVHIVPEVCAAFHHIAAALLPFSKLASQTGNVFT
jgi:hypothetical protein